MSIEENKEVVRRFYEEACNGRRFELLAELFAPDYVHHDPQLPPEAQRGLENYTQGIRGFYGAFPDLTATIEDMLAEDDRVMTRVSWSGTHTGDLFGMPATGKTVSFAMMEVHRLAGGRIVEGWAVYDALGLMQQIGAAPAGAGV